LEFSVDGRMVEISRAAERQPQPPALQHAEAGEMASALRTWFQDILANIMPIPQASVIPANTAPAPTTAGTAIQ
jgi:hypothetical protein